MDEAQLERREDDLRATADAQGRLWISSDGLATRVDERAPPEQRVHTMAMGFTPSEYTVETNGVVWMWDSGHFVRYDPNLPVPTRLQLRASVGRYFRVPTLFELFGDRGFVVGNEGLDPEWGVGIDGRLPGQPPR